MCLAVPGKIINIGKEHSAEVDFSGVQRIVQLDLLPEAKVGDFVLVHAGFAIQTISPEDAKETIDLLNQAFNDNK